MSAASIFRSLFRRLLSGITAACLLSPVFFLQACNEPPVTHRKITIGYQTPTAQLWSALVMKHQRLVEKHAEKAGIKGLKVEWQDFLSGPPITNAMIGRKIDVGFMGDMPLLVNAAAGQEGRGFRSVIIAMDGKGESGQNQAIMSGDPSVKTLEDLRGRTVSTIFGSSAHRMLLLVLAQKNLLDSVEVIHQDVSTGMVATEQGKVAAHATWDPYPRLMEQRALAKKLSDGSESGADYLAGIVASVDLVESQPGVVKTFLSALVEAHQFIRNFPDEASRIFAAESGFPLSICRQEALNILWDSRITGRDRTTLASDAEFLIKLGRIKALDIDRAIDDRWLEKDTN